MKIIPLCACAALLAMLAGCASTPTPSGKTAMFSEQRATEHRAECGTA